MDIRIRRLLLFLSIILFLVIAPVVVLYALGYRENIISSPTAVGVLLLDSIPSDATASVDGTDYGNTPESIPNLQVGSVSVTVTKPDYHPWQKNLPIRPARATEARAIRLFLQDPPIETVSPQTQRFALAPNRTLLAWVDSTNMLHIDSTENERLFTPLPLSAAPKSLLWSSDSSYLLLGYQAERYQVVDIAADQLRATPLPSLNGYTDPSWDMRTPGRILFQDPATSNLIRYSLRQNQQEILAANVRTYAVSASELYIVTQQQQFQRLSLDGELRRNQPLQLNSPQETITQLLVTPNDDIAAISNTQQLYLYQDQSFQSLTNHVLHAAWSPDGSMLLIQPQTNELFVYNVSNERAFHIPLDQMLLVTRLSRPIQHAQWFAGGNHFIYQVDDAINITEIDTRDHPITHTIDTTNLGDASVTVGQDGQILYYLKRQDNQTRLVSATLYREE